MRKLEIIELISLDGVTRINSGGHLALMIAGSADSPVNAVAAIAPPTDLANWGKPGFILTVRSRSGRTLRSMFDEREVCA
jgi:hypothetical protein